MKLKPEHLALREENYNATITKWDSINDHLAILHIKPDNHFTEFKAGQFLTIGLYNFENPKIDKHSEEKLIRRAYSVSSPILNIDDELHDYQYADYYELYVILVDDGELTPKLFNLREGDRLFLVEKALGHYVMPKEMKKEDTIIFASTGTGLAPHNAMLVDMLKKFHDGQIIVFDSVRYDVDLGYRKLLKKLHEKYENLNYIPVVTSKMEAGKKVYIQDFFKDDLLEKQYGISIDPSSTHVFCCGNPNMIGAPRINKETGEATFPIEGGLVELLMKKYGLTIHSRTEGGNIHFEKYF